eukprot:COSAG01_NODE_1466_length_10220_cov_15.883608_1_plen_71_part_00
MEGSMDVHIMKIPQHPSTSLPTPRNSSPPLPTPTQAPSMGDQQLSYCTRRRRRSSTDSTRHCNRHLHTHP